MEYKNTPQQTAALDQMEASLENMARLVGIYYKSLRKEGIPKPMAFELVMDYHQFTLSRIPDSD